MTTTDTARTDAVTLVKCYCPKCVTGVHDDLELADRYRRNAELRERAEKAEADVERLKDLLSQAIIEIEMTPFHTPRLTAFTAHKLGERYREKMTNTSTKPLNAQEDDK